MDAPGTSPITILHWPKARGCLNRVSCHPTTSCTGRGRVVVLRPPTSGLARAVRCRSCPVRRLCGRIASLVVTAFSRRGRREPLFAPTSCRCHGPACHPPKVPYERWLRFVWPVLLGLTIHRHGHAEVIQACFLQGTPTLKYGVHSEGRALCAASLVQPGIRNGTLTPAIGQSLLFRRCAVVSNKPGSSI